MAKAGFYAVAKGRVPGIYDSWEDCEPQVKGYTGARYKKFKTLRQAEEFVNASSPTSPSLPTSTAIASTSTSLLPVPVTASSSAARVRFSLLRNIVNPIKALASRKMAKPDISTEKNVNEEGYDVVYADGACKGNGQQGSVAGIGVWWGRNDPRNIAERCPGAQTNNRAELIAIVRVLEEAPIYGRPLLIKTDSTYSIKCLREWHQTWAHKDWKTSSGKPVLNAQLIQYLLSLLQLRHLQGFPVKLVYVKGHSGVEGNEGADRLANEGAMMPEKWEREWEVERWKVEGVLKALKEGVDVMDKAVQVESEEGVEAAMEQTEVGVDVHVDVEVSDSRTGATTTTAMSVSAGTSISAPAPMKDRNSADKQTAGTSNSSASTATPAARPSSSAATVTAVAKSTAASDSGAIRDPQARPQIQSSNNDVVNNDEFGLDCLLDPDELEKELAEA